MKVRILVEEEDMTLLTDRLGTVTTQSTSRHAAETPQVTDHPEPEMTQLRNQYVDRQDLIRDQTPPEPRDSPRLNCPYLATTPEPKMSHLMKIPTPTRTWILTWKSPQL